MMTSIPSLRISARRPSGKSTRCWTKVLLNRRLFAKLEGVHHDLSVDISQIHIDVDVDLPASARKRFNSLVLLTTWELSKHRNGCVFDGLRPSVSCLTENIRQEVQLRARARANGLHNIVGIG